MRNPLIYFSLSLFLYFFYNKLEKKHAYLFANIYSVSCFYFPLPDTPPTPLSLIYLLDNFSQGACERARQTHRNRVK